MVEYKESIKNCIAYLNSVRFPCEDWKEDKFYFDGLEKEFFVEATDEETQQLDYFFTKNMITLVQLICIYWIIEMNCYQIV